MRRRRGTWRIGVWRALASGACDLIGLARPMCLAADLPARLLNGEAETAPSYEKLLRIGPGFFGPGSKNDVMRALNGFATMAFFYQNLFRLADGFEAKEKMALLPAFIRQQRHELKAARALKR